MREIKFRAWDKVAGNMFIIFDASEQTEWFLPKWKERFEVMQYTGLKNHKGTEVYEGDIIHARGHYPGEGWYDTGEHEYNFKNEVKWDNDKLAYTCGGYYLHEINIIKIIGNRYQNPELLKE